MSIGERRDARRRCNLAADERSSQDRSCDLSATSQAAYRPQSLDTRRASTPRTRLAATHVETSPARAGPDLGAQRAKVYVAEAFALMNSFAS